MEVQSHDADDIESRGELYESSQSRSVSEWDHPYFLLLQSISDAVDVDSGPNQATQSTSEHDSIEWRKDVVVVSMECE